MLAFAHFLENAAAGALPLKPFERTFQGLIFADTYLGHCYPSPRSRQWTERIPCSTRSFLNDYTEKAFMSQLFSSKQETGKKEKNRKKLIKAGSRHPVGHFAAAEDMKMQMMDGLAGVVSAV